MTTWYAVSMRGKGEPWAHCSSYPSEADAVERLQYEATTVSSPDQFFNVESDRVVLLNRRHLRTRDGFEMRIEPIEVTE